MPIVLDGGHLTIEQVVRAAREHEVASLSAKAGEAVCEAREYVERKLAEGAVIYGLTTGFGKFQDTFIPPEKASLLQYNLIRSHSCGTGEPLPEEAVRAMLLLRVNALAKGYSGVRLATLETLLDMLNRGLTPIVPEKGSLGASGDLIQLAHMVLPMIGEGEALYAGVRTGGRDAMAMAGIPLVELASKEGLALINGTQAMCAIGALALHDATEMARAADVLAAMCCEAQLAITKAFDPKIQEARGHNCQIGVAANLRKLLEGSKLAAAAVPGKVQDAYCIRCIPQIHGASREAFAYATNVLTNEINAATDNPLIFAADDEVLSGGNFHGQPVAIALDTLGIATAELAGVSERRIERLVNPALSNGLPAFLSPDGGLNSGFMITQYAAASLVSENKIYAHPASVDSIPSSANQEDHVSMGATAARTARMIADNTLGVLAIELFAVCQALHLRGEGLMAPATKAVYDRVREAGVPVVGDDILMYPQIEKCRTLIKAGEVVEAAESVCGKLN
ncbi:MAG: histidine ammonia-lyase [Oscillospiraceae bacterium]|nr:histidine ammonia-lyase [Oscillospiraceae bacterium]